MRTHPREQQSARCDVNGQALPSPHRAQTNRDSPVRASNTGDGLSSANVDTPSKSNRPLPVGHGSTGSDARAVTSRTPVRTVAVMATLAAIVTGCGISPKAGPPNCATHAGIASATSPFPRSQLPRPFPPHQARLTSATRVTRAVITLAALRCQPTRLRLLRNTIPVRQRSRNSEPLCLQSRQKPLHPGSTPNPFRHAALQTAQRC